MKIPNVYRSNETTGKHDVQLVEAQQIKNLIKCPYYPRIGIHL